MNRTAPEGQFSQEVENATVPTVKAEETTAVTAPAEEPVAAGSIDFSDEEAAAASEALENESDEAADISADETGAEENDSLTPEKLADKNKQEILETFASLLESKPVGACAKTWRR